MLQVLNSSTDFHCQSGKDGPYHGQHDSARQRNACVNGDYLFRAE